MKIHLKHATRTATEFESNESLNPICTASCVESIIPLPGSRGLPEKLHGGKWSELVDAPQHWVTGG